ncbi:MAG: hypothetical protein GEU26_17490 [Nitrososphaeraceae archaeon]|nr:hypothetical protein [Nitrososphaeraceae archaeon]
MEYTPPELTHPPFPPSDGARCSLCQKPFQYRDWRDDNEMKGIEIVRMRLRLCDECFNTKKGNKIPDEGDGGDKSKIYTLKLQRRKNL